MLKKLCCLALTTSSPLFLEALPNCRIRSRKTRRRTAPFLLQLRIYPIQGPQAPPALLRIGATSAAPDSSDSGATGATSAVPALPGLPPVPSASTPSESEGERTAKAALKDGVPERKGKDTGLKESLLSEALVKCTGWGQSTGSSLHAAAAATQILDWSNQAGAGKADKAALFKTVETEYKRLSDEQQKNLQNNWSFISYDVETMLDSFADIEGVLSDAGCLETAKAAVADENVLENWKAAHDALEAAVNEK